MKVHRMKGITTNETCPKCHGTFSSDDYDYESDLCLYCLFPEVGRSKPAEMDYSEGVAKNRTKEGQQLDDLDFTPEKQSKQAIESKLLHDYKKKTKSKPKAL